MRLNIPSLLIIAILKSNIYSNNAKLNSNIPKNKSQKHEFIIMINNWEIILKETFHTGISLSTAEWIYDENEVKIKELPKCSAFHGVIKGYAEDSFVILTQCDKDISGLLRIGEDHFEIGTAANGQLIILQERHKRSADEKVEDDWQYYNLTGDLIELATPSTNEYWLDDEEDDEASRRNEENDTDDGNRTWHWRTDYSDIDSDDIGYFFDRTWQPEILYAKQDDAKILTKKRWLEIAVAVDSTVISFHGKERIEKYVLSLMNIVNVIYRDPSLGSNIHLVITKLLFYPNKKHTMIRPGNAKRSLENVNAWNQRLHLGMAPGESHHDVAVWLTRADIGGPSGYAPVAGVCDPKRSCSLNRDEGLTSAFIIAHEMAHTLGLSHDGDLAANNTCEDRSYDGNIMATMVSATFHRFAWSHCSRKEFRKKIGKWKCLLNAPNAANHHHIFLNDTLDITFSMDEQCRMEFGEGYALCRAFDVPEPCSHLWCGHETSPLVCKTKKGPPIENTECGFDKVCIEGYCQRREGKVSDWNPIQYNPQHGGWSNWTDWGPCSRSCGAGVTFRSRKCNNPIPSFGGSNCFGLNEEWKICNTESCPEPIKDIRMEQCQRLPQLLNVNGPKVNLTWLPYESEEKALKCKLTCMSKETKELHISDENLIDGTPCSYESAYDICIQGTCFTLGCDHKLFSSVTEDSCGVCGGNNSECTHIKSSTIKKLKKDVTRILILPRFSREIKIEANFVTAANNTDPLVAFVLKDRKRKTYTITIPNAGVFSDIIEGAKFYYKKIQHNHLIWAKGPLLSELLILVYSLRSDVKTGISITFSSEYYMNRNVLNGTKHYQWLLGGWGSCSKSCDTGRRHKTVACYDASKKKIVPRKFCSLIEKPSLEHEKCNQFSCNFHWISGGWEPCSFICGPNGLQQREIYCVPQSVTYNGTIYKENDPKMQIIYKHMVHQLHCGEEKPSEQQTCNRIPCPGVWKYNPWSTCSVSCGSGLSTRQSICQSLYENEAQDVLCSGSPTIVQRCQLNNRFTHSKCRYRNVERCFDNQSIYCELSELQKYCRLRGFRRLCCKACAVKNQNDVENDVQL